MNHTLIGEFDAHIAARIHKGGQQMPLALICLGLSGESGEVIEILEEVLPEIDFDEVNLLRDARENLKLELGDTLWYVVGAWHALGSSLSHEMDLVGHLEPGPRRPLAVLVGAFCDMVKKVEWHGKAPDGKKLRDALVPILVELGMVARDNNLSLNEVMSGNIDKLNKRYPLEAGGFVEGGGIR